MSRSVAELVKVSAGRVGAPAADIRRACTVAGMAGDHPPAWSTQLRNRLPGPGLLSAKQLAAIRRLPTHLVHAEPDGRSPSLRWSGCPVSKRSVHDHLSWCCTAVLQGTEYERGLRRSRATTLR